MRQIEELLGIGCEDALIGREWHCAGVVYEIVKFEEYPVFDEPGVTSPTIVRKLVCKNREYSRIEYSARELLMPLKNRRITGDAYTVELLNRWVGGER